MRIVAASLRILCYMLSIHMHTQFVHVRLIENTSFTLIFVSINLCALSYVIYFRCIIVLTGNYMESYRFPPQKDAFLQTQQYH
jgi:hypothetical protein